MRSIILWISSAGAWIAGLALSLGGIGLFAVAFVDSSLLGVPGSADLGVVVLSARHHERMLYYALMATSGSVAGCYLLYFLAERGGEAFIHKRLKPGATQRALDLYKRHGVLALVVPALLPPPAPFKLFVLMAGVAEVRPLKFAAAIAAARGLRYLVLGILAVNFGDEALVLMQEHGGEVGLWLAAALIAAAVAYWLVRSRQQAAGSRQ